MFGPIRPQVIISQSKLSKQHPRTTEKWLMWHFTSRNGKQKKEISHALVFSVPGVPLPSASPPGACPLWTALTWAPLPSGFHMVWPMGGPGRRWGAGGGRFYSLSFVAVLPEAVLLLGGPSSMALALTGLRMPRPLLPSALGWKRSFLQCLAYRCFTGPL